MSLEWIQFKDMDAFIKWRSDEMKAGRMGMCHPLFVQFPDPNKIDALIYMNEHGKHPPSSALNESEASNA
jgi:hypothetical protein